MIQNSRSGGTNTTSSPRSLRTMRQLGLVLLACVALSTSALAGPKGTIRYRVSVSNPAEQKIHVAITVNPGGSSNIRFEIPAWTPGYYQILNFQRDVSGLRVTDSAGAEISTTRPGERTWEVATSGKEITMEYDITAKDAGFGFFNSHLDAKTGYLNGASALMYVVDGKESPATLEVKVPEGWRHTSPLETDGENRYRATGYDELIDSPLQMGEFERIDFTVGQTPFSAILVGGKDVDQATMTDMLKGVSEQGIKLFGSAPFKRYHYIFHFAPGSFGGGLEHRNSTVLNVSSRMARFPKSGTDLVAHEYFHAWNVKRIHPAGLGPFNYTDKVRTPSLWFAEGVTDYYASVLPRMAGFTTEDEFLQGLAGTIRELQNNPARLKVTAEEASMKSWEGGSFGFAGLSYYNKGSLLGLALDVKIRAATDNRKSLDDVMRLLDRRYGAKGVGYPDDGILKAVNEVSGKDFGDFYSRYVRSTEEIPWNEILHDAGLRYDAGTERIADLGARHRVTEDKKITVTRVTEDSAADAAGLKVGDVIESVGGETMDPAAWEKLLASLKPDQKLDLTVSREGHPVKLAVTVGARERRYVRMTVLPDAGERAERIRKGLVRAERHG